MNEIFLYGLIAALVSVIFGIIVILPTYIWLKFHQLRARKGDINSAQIVGNYLYKQKEFEGSIQYFEILLNINPNHMESLENLAFCYLRTKRYDKAFPLFNRLHEEDSLNASHMFYLGYCLHTIGDQTSALKYQEEALKLDKKLKYTNYYIEL